MEWGFLQWGSLLWVGLTPWALQSLMRQMSPSLCLRDVTFSHFLPQNHLKSGAYDQGNSGAVRSGENWGIRLRSLRFGHRVPRLRSLRRFKLRLGCKPGLGLPGAKRGLCYGYAEPPDSRGPQAQTQLRTRGPTPLPLPLSLSLVPGQAGGQDECEPWDGPRGRLRASGRACQDRVRAHAWAGPGLLTLPHANTKSNTNTNTNTYSSHNSNSSHNSSRTNTNSSGRSIGASSGVSGSGSGGSGNGSTDHMSLLCPELLKAGVPLASRPNATTGAPKAGGRALPLVHPVVVQGAG